MVAMVALPYDVKAQCGDLPAWHSSLSIKSGIGCGNVPSHEELCQSPMEGLDPELKGLQSPLAEYFEPQGFFAGSAPVAMVVPPSAPMTTCFWPGSFAIQQVWPAGSAPALLPVQMSSGVNWGSMLAACPMVNSIAPAMNVGGHLGATSEAHPAVNSAAPAMNVGPACMFPAASKTTELPVASSSNRSRQTSQVTPAYEKGSVHDPSDCPSAVYVDLTCLRPKQSNHVSCLSHRELTWGLKDMKNEQ
jgi:hypothetical protein